MQLVRDPESDVALDFLRTELKLFGNAKRCLQVVADCQVRYEGRARSMLHRGERVILLKPDGTFLIHSAKGAKPVNWQPPGATLTAGMEDGHLVLTAYRPKPEEIVRVQFHEIALLLAFPIRDEEELDLVGSEDDLQALLYQRPDLVEAGFVPRRRERDNVRGRYDIDGDDKDGKRMIVEIKRVTAGVGDAQQLWRYVEELRGKGKKAKAVRGILIAPRVAPKARELLKSHHLEWKELDLVDLLPKMEKMRRTGQVGLGRF